MTRMTGPDCAVMCNLINTHTHTHTSYPICCNITETKCIQIVHGVPFFAFILVSSLHGD